MPHRRFIVIATFVVLASPPDATAAETDREHGPVDAASLHLAIDTFSPLREDGSVARPTTIVQAQLAIDLNLSRVALDGVRVRISAVANNGASISDRLGDVQGASSLELGFSGVRLHEAWAVYDLHPSHQLSAGLIDLSGRIDQLDASASLANGAFTLGTDLGQANTDESGRMPFTAWGGAVESRIAPNVRVRGGILFGMGRVNRIAGSDREEFSSGEFIFAEGQVEFVNAKLLAGNWHHNSRNANGRDRDDKGVYARGEALLWRDADHPTRTLTGFVRAGTSDASLNLFHRFASAGLQLTGTFPGRDDDMVTVGIATAIASRHKWHGAQTMPAETVYEAGYTAHFGPILSGQIGFQHISATGLAFEGTSRSEIHLRLAFNLPLATGSF